MDADALIERAVELFSLPKLMRVPLVAHAKRRAARLGIGDIFADMLREYDAEQNREDKQDGRATARGAAPVDVERDGNGRALTTINNFLAVLRGDPFFADIRYNLLSACPETTEDGRPRRWEDADDARARGYIEGVYRIHSDAKYKDAMRQLFIDRAYHPIHDMINMVTWDGVNRIEGFLHKWTRCEDTPYTRECSRLIFAGGIHRVYQSGCKFDDMVVLIGIRQGEGKSTLVRWLALDDRYFREVTEIEGQKGMEAIDGAWICEVGELLALTKIKEQEAVKSYLTRQVDSYRKPYDTRVSDHPRQCIFIGTTNKREFLTDMTGGRRFYPVEVSMSGYDLYDQQEAVRHDIQQCWAEALRRFHDEKDGIPPYANRALYDDIRNMQARAQEDDYRQGMIEKYLEDRDVVCGIELWHEALREEKSPTRKDYADIGAVMQRIGGWIRPEERRFFPRWGRQRIWKRCVVTIQNEAFTMVENASQTGIFPEKWENSL